jgi:hypothetical protein
MAGSTQGQSLLRHRIGLLNGTQAEICRLLPVWQSDRPPGAPPRSRLLFRIHCQQFPLKLSDFGSKKANRTQATSPAEYRIQALQRPSNGLNSVKKVES